jgi:methylmalonyl-CoA/ethylmalonyl-CoA epimerase
MKLTKIEHIGIAVKSLDESIKFYEEILGLKCYATEIVEDQKVKTAFFQIGETKIELLESTHPDGPVSKFIEKRGEGIHHIAFKTNNINSSLKELKEKNVKLIDENPRKGAEQLDVGFIHPKSAHGVLIELCG